MDSTTTAAESPATDQQPSTSSSLHNQCQDSESKDSTTESTTGTTASSSHHQHHRSHRHHHHSHHHHHNRSTSGGGGGSSSQLSNNIIKTNNGWFQKRINLRPVHRGCHLVTDEVVKQVPEMNQFQVGICNLHIMHTSASLTLNENWDPDVREDMEMFLLQFVPENLQFRHVCEGPDDMPAHVKSAFLGSSLTIPITEGKLCLGTWQGIWLCEHRNNAGSRKIMVTINGALKN